MHIASDEKVMGKKLDEYEQTFVGKRKRSVVKREMQQDVKREKCKVAIVSASYMNDIDKKKLINLVNGFIARLLQYYFWAYWVSILFTHQCVLCVIDQLFFSARDV